MAVDKKSDYVGNHGGAYSDIDGMSRQFTYIDHDKKSRISFSIPEEAVKVYNESVERTIDEILQFPAVSVLKDDKDNLFEIYVKRDRDNGITWREDMVRETLRLNSNLRYVMHLRAWRGTVKFQYWWEDMSHEDIMAGKWKEWT